MHLRDISRYSVAAVRRLRQRSSSNFKIAFVFLRSDQRLALEQVYGFCRVVDDIVDERAPGPQGEQEARDALDGWRREVEAIFRDGPSIDLATRLGPSLREARIAFDLPRPAFDAIIDGVAMDLEQTTYADQDKLAAYCHRVASCVGLLCIAIFGDQCPAAQDYARHLGLALQYTNILRDVGEDAARGRVYLPLDLLERHGLGAADILRQRYDHRFLGAANEFADVAQREYEAAWTAFAEIQDPRTLLSAEIMGRTYHAILKRIQGEDYNVFAQRTSLRRRDKLRVAAWTIARTNLMSSLASTGGPRR